MDVNIAQLQRDAAAENLQGETEIDRSNDWTVFEGKDGAKFLNTGISIYQLLENDDYAALRMPSETARSTATGEPLVLFPYKNAESGLVVEPGREYLSGSMPEITQIMARIAANEPWTVPAQSSGSTVKQQMASKRALFDLDAGADEKTVLQTLEKEFARIEAEDGDERDSESDDDSFGTIRKKIDGANGDDSNVRKSSALDNRFESEQSGSGSGGRGDSGGSSSSSEEESEQGNGGSFDADNSAFEQTNNDSFGGAAQHANEEDDDDNENGAKTTSFGAALGGVGIDVQVGNVGPAAAPAQQLSASSGFATNYGRMPLPLKSWGVKVRDLEAGGDNDDDSEFGSEERAVAQKQENEHAASMESVRALFEAGDAIDDEGEDFKKQYKQTETRAVPPLAENAANLEGYFDDDGGFIDADGGYTTTDGLYYAPDGSFAGVVDETGGFYDNRDGSYTDASGLRYDGDQIDSAEGEVGNAHAGVPADADNNDFEMFNGARLPVVKARERTDTDLVGLSAREARRAQRERESRTKDIEATRRTITEVSEEQRANSGKKKTLADELKAFGMPGDLLKSFAASGALDKEIDDGSSAASNYEQIAHMGKRLLTPKERDQSAKKDAEKNTDAATQQTIESAAPLQAQVPLQRVTELASSGAQSLPRAAPGDQVRSNKAPSAAAISKLMRASAAQLEANAAQMRAFADLYDIV